MFLENVDSIIWLLVIFGALVFVQRLLHKEIQYVMLLLTRRVDIVLTLFSLILFPGVLIHEVSHFIMARILSVQTGRLSLLPRLLEDGTLQMGYVETARAGVFREALIGMAPLLTGGLIVTLAGQKGLGLDTLWMAFSTDPLKTIPGVLAKMLEKPDFWLWFYLTFVVSSTMLPSTSDRRAWIPLLLVFGMILGAIGFAGIGPWLAEHLGPYLNMGLKALTVVFGISVTIHSILLIPTWIIRKLLSIILKIRIV